MHTTTGNHRLGLFLALTTAVMWGTLPIALKILLDQMDAITITWFRFLVAALLLGGYLLARGMLPRIRRSAAVSILLAFAIAGLAGNYLLYLLGLDSISPGTAQIVIQLAPLLLLLGSLVIFRERFSPMQWLGVVLFIGGLLLFFNRRLLELTAALGGETTGVLMIVAASFTWAAYALAQKQLLNQYASEQVMFVIYVASIFIFWPISAPSSLSGLTPAGGWILAYCCLNTLIAYGSFAEALEHWEASRVSAVLAITPLLTLFFVAVTNHLMPELLAPEKLNATAIAGAFLVVAGSMMTALGKSTAMPTDFE